MLDLDGCLTFFADDGNMTLANAPTLHGKEAILTFAGPYFKSMHHQKHHLEAEYRPNESTVIVEGRSTLTRHDGTELIVPFSGFFNLRGGLIASYRAYCDMSKF